MKQLKARETNLIITVIISLILTCVLIFLCANKIFIHNANLLNGVLTVSGVLIGFTITSIGVFYTVPLRPEIKRALLRQGYYLQISRNYFICAIAFSLSLISCIICLCLVDASKIVLHIISSISLIALVFGLVLLIMTTYHLYVVVTRKDMLELL